MCKTNKIGSWDTALGQLKGFTDWVGTFKTVRVVGQMLNGIPGVCPQNKVFKFLRCGTARQIRSSTFSMVCRMTS